MKARDVIPGWPCGRSTSRPTRYPVVLHRYWLKRLMDDYVPVHFHPSDGGVDNYIREVTNVLLAERLEERHRFQTEMAFNMVISAYRNPQAIAARRAAEDGGKVKVVGKCIADNGKWTVFFSNQTCTEVTEEIAEQMYEGREVELQRETIEPPQNNPHGSCRCGKPGCNGMHI